MRNQKFRMSLFLALLLVFQLFFPIANTFAETNSSILPPSNLAVQQVTPDNVKLTWSSVYGATGYNVYEITEGQLILLGKTTTTNYSLNNLEEGSYRYVVSTLTSEGESGPCAPVSVDIVYPDMAAPTTLTQTIKNGNDIVLNWGASQYAESYNLYQISEDGEKTLLTSPTTRTHTISNAPEGQYTYTVSAVNSLYGESPLANSVQVEVVYPSMAAPGNLTYTVADGSDVTLKWDSVPYATSYEIYQIIDEQRVLKSTVTSTTVKFTNVPGGDYVYEVRSNSDRFGESAEGSQLAVTVGTVTMTAPSNFAYKLQNTNDIVLTWGSVPYANSYKVYQIIDGQKVLKSTLTGTTVTYTKMPAGDYVYVVHSYSDRFGESEEGSKVSLTVETVTMAAPDNFTYTIKNGNDIVLNWGSVSDATNYKIYQIVNGQKVLKSTVTGTTVTYTNMSEGEYKYEVYSYSTRFGESQDGSQLSFSLAHPTMQPPENVVQTIKNATDFTLSWDAALYATSYKVYQISNGQKTLKSTMTGTSVTYTKMAPGEYTFVVHSYSSRFGESSEGTELKLTLNGQTMQAPKSPNYSIANGNDITLRWTAAEYATSYKVYQVTEEQKVLKSTVTGTAVTYTNLPGGDYHFVVHSVSSLLGESPEGAEITISLELPVMAPPGNLAYKIQNGNDVVLTWGTVQYSNSYKVYELINGEKVLKNTVTSLSATLPKVPSGEHTYIVHSVSTRFGESPEGSQVACTLNENTMQVPANLTYTITNGNDITLKWNAVTYATAYNVYQIIDEQLVLQKTVTGTAVTFANKPEGEYKYVVHSYSSDRYGESPDGSEVTFTLVHPTMQAPTNLTYSITSGNDITLKWNTVTNATGYNVYQVIDGQKVFKRAVTGTSAAFINMSEDEYEYVVHSVSTRFGESAEGSEVTFTLVHPIMHAPANLTNSITNGNDIILRWNAATYATSYKVYQIINGQKELKKTMTGTSISFINMPEGEYQYEVHSNSDRFGESPEGGKLDFTLTWPVVQAPQLTGTISNVNNMTLSWKSVPWANEYRVYQMTGDNRQLIYKGTALTFKVYNITEDTHSFEVTTYSTRFGESEASNRITENIVYPEMQPPAASLTLLSPTSARINWDFVTYANGYNIYEMIDGKSVLVVEKVNNLSYTLNNLSYANHEYYVTSYSNSFGQSEPSNIVLAKLIIDTEPPVTKSNVPTGWTKENPVVTLTATDDETGVANTYYAVDDSVFVEGTSFAVNGEGVHKVSFYSIDKVGNKEAIQTIDIKIDQTAPVTQVSDVPAWYNQMIVLKLTGTDTQSGVAKTFYSINDSEYVEGTSVTVDREGVNKVSYYSVDQAGNMENAQTIEVKIDKTAPVTTSDALETWSKEDVTVKWSAMDTGSGVAKTLYSVNSTEYVEGSTLTIQKEGIHNISFYSVDTAGNREETKRVIVKVDKTAPVLTMNLNEEYKLGTVLPLVYSAIDDLSEIVSVKMVVSGPNLTTGSELANGASLTLDKPGVYTVTVVATNAAGLTTTIEKQFVIYLPATIEVTPKVIKGNNGVFTVRVDLPKGYSSQGFDLNTARLNGVKALTSNNGYYNQAKLGQFKFERADFTWTTREVTLEFRSYVNGYLVVGQTTVKVQK